ncbi:MAG: hypothetical protein WDN00_14625 [Limisphaerales bacterium]
MTANLPPGVQNFHRPGQSAFQRADLVVHRDAQRLNNLRGRMRFFSRCAALGVRSIPPAASSFQISSAPGREPSLSQTAANPVHRHIPQKIFASVSASSPFTRLAAVSSCRSSIRMSSGPSCWKLNPALGHIELRRTHAQIPAAHRHNWSPESNPPAPKNPAPDLKTPGKPLHQPGFRGLNRDAIAIAPRTAIQSVNSRPKCSPRDQLHRASRRRNDRPGAASTRPAPPPPSLVCE